MMRLRLVPMALAIVLASCGVGEGTPEAGHAAAVTTSTEIAIPTITETTQSLVDQRPLWIGFDSSNTGEVTLAALALGETTVYESPSLDSPSRLLPWATILGTVSVYSIVGEPEDGWAKILLPGRPNGTVGWVRTDDVAIYVVEGEIVVDLSDRELVYYRNGVEVLRSPVAIGTAQNPTPTGHFYVTDTVTMSYEGSPWGPHALGLSARSDTITEFNGGDGIIGIHGTNRPSSIGQAASLGCVRLPNDVITALHRQVPIGTPVEIRA